MKNWGFVGATYTGQSISADGQRAVNLYPEAIESGTGKAGHFYLLGTPGLKMYAALPDGPVRAIYLTPDYRRLAVSGGTLYELVPRDQPETTPEFPLDSRLKNLISKAAGKGPLEAADDWSFQFNAITSATGPAPETYGFGDGEYYGRDDLVTVDQWWQLFTAPYWYNVLGQVERSEDPASICSNGSQVFIVSNGHGYVLERNALAEVQVPALRMAGFVDGYIVGLNAQSRRFQISKLYDGKSWNALDFAYAEGAPDNLTSMLIDHREVWLFGEKRTEIYWNSGNPDFPFERINGAYIEAGCADPWSPAKVDNTILWRGSDEHGGGMVWRATGWTPSRVSNHAVEWRTRKYAGGISYPYQDGGHTFYSLYFPGARESWVLDAATGMWHERAWWDAAHGRYQAHRGRCHAYIGGKHLIGDRETGAIYEQDSAYRDDAGEPLRWLRSSPHISNEMKWMYYNSLHLDMQAGVGLADGQGNDPAVFLRASNDGGFTWGDYLQGSMGKIGHTRHRARWNRLGRSRDRCFEVTGSDPVKVALLDAYLDVAPGSGY